MTKVEKALSTGGKQIEKEEKKRIKADISVLQKLLSKAKPEKMTADDLRSVRDAMSVLESSSARICQEFGESSEQ